jgi:hypothetical protein
MSRTGKIEAGNQKSKNVCRNQQNSNALISALDVPPITKINNMNDNLRAEIRK